MIRLVRDNRFPKESFWVYNGPITSNDDYYIGRVWITGDRKWLGWGTSIGIGIGSAGTKEKAINYLKMSGDEFSNLYKND